MKKNILIIDDSALMRRVISDIINSDDRFIVSDIAKNGLEGFELLVSNINKYDVVLLDINMPKMNGIELLEQVVKNNIKATIIIVSTVAKKGAKETIRALELGAFDFVTKPEGFLESKSDIFKNKIIQCLILATNQSSTITDPISYNRPKRRNDSINWKEPSYAKGNTKLIALACSTGGPKALQMVIPKIPAEIDAAMIIVQHMPEGFTKTLATRLNELSKVTVKEAVHGEIIKKGFVYLAKGGSQLRIVGQPTGEYKLSVTVEPARNGLKPCADIMFESLLDSSFNELTCVILTGMGSDGTKGIKQLYDKKKIYVIAQDEGTCTVYGMPKVVADSGLVDEVVPLNDIARAITTKVGVH